MYTERVNFVLLFILLFIFFWTIARYAVDTQRMSMALISLKQGEHITRWKRRHG